MKRLPLALLTMLSLLLAACSKDGTEETAAVRLRSISIEATSIVLPVKGSAELPFSVQDPDFVFDHSISSSGCQISLVGTDGMAPAYFHLSVIIVGTESGSYKAMLQDDGISTDYSGTYRLTIVSRDKETGIFSRASSPDFTVRSAGDGVEEDEGGDDDPEGEVPEDDEIGTGLPVVHVDTENDRPVVFKDIEVPATLTIKGNGTYEGLPETVCTIRGRGNTTWSWPKKPYLIRLEEKAHIFGMHKHKRWVLLANFMDRTLMRNIVSMKVSSMTSLAWTPGCVPVELVLNGKHRGNYLLIEQVRVDNHRVAVTEMTPQDNSGEALTGGYLLELDFHYDNPVQWYEHGIPFSVKYPDAEDLTSEQESYIRSYIKEVSDVIYGADFADPQKGYAKYLDVDSFVDYWIVFEVMGNHELGNPGSVYFHKDRGGKLVAGPCWDFDWGVLSYNTSPHARNGLVNGKAIWYARLFQDPAFKARVKERFNELLPQLQTIPAFIDETEALLERSAELNFAMWNPAEDASMNNGQIINGDEKMTFHDAVRRLRSIFEDRLRVIPKNL